MSGEHLIHGRFRRVAIAGRGSFGRVLEVVDLQTNEPRALKIVPRGPHEGTLLDEFEQLARLRHPSLPRVFEVGRTTEPIDDIAPGAAFFAAEWIAGARSDSRSWSGSQIWALLADVAGALATIHAAGLVHADVAPQNVLVTAERAFLVDLGLAATAGGGGDGARGTPLYMAPEAFAGHVEPRSDLYGLGATAIRLLTGRPPFEAATLGELVQQIVTGRAAQPLPGIPRPLADLINRLAHRDLDARPPSALAVLDELDQLASAIDVGGAARRARPKVGPPPAPATWPGASAWIDQLTADLAAGPLAIVVGSLASGARQLVDAALRRRQLAEAAQGFASTPVVAGELDAVGAQLGVAPFAVPGPSATRSWIERVARAASESTAIVVFELGADARADDLIAALARHAAGQPSFVIADGIATRSNDQRTIAIADGIATRSNDQRTIADGIATRSNDQRTIVIVDGLGPQLERRRDLAIRRAPILDVDEVGALAESMLRTRPPPAWTQALHVASDGMALTVVELLRSVVDERDPLAVDWSDRAAAGVVALRVRALQQAPSAARHLATAIAVWGGRARVDRVLATARLANPAERIWLGDLVALERLGLAQRRRTTGFDGEVFDEVLIDRNTSDAALELAGPEVVAATASAALAAQQPDAIPEGVVFDTPSARNAAIHRAVRKLSTDEIAAGRLGDLDDELDATAVAGRGGGQRNAAAVGGDSDEREARRGARVDEVRPRRATKLSAEGRFGDEDDEPLHDDIVGDDMPSRSATGSAGDKAPHDDRAGLRAGAVASGFGQPPSDVAVGRLGDLDDLDTLPPQSARETSPGIGAVGPRTSTEPRPSTGPRTLAELAPVLELIALDDTTGELTCDVAEELLAAGRGDRALVLARRAIEVVPARACLVAARASAAVAAYRDVADLARAAVEAGADPIEAELVVARAAQRAGALDDAEATLARLHADHPAHAEVAGTYARLLVTRARYADARKIALAAGPLAGLRAEAAGLAAFYLGELADADAAFAALELGATAASDEAAIGRALSLRGMVAQQRGQLGLASDRYQDAARRLHEVGELHAAAVADLNLGTVLSERGRASDALPRLASAARVFADLGATTELIAADLNRGNALLAVGQPQDALVAAEAALAHAGGSPHLRAFALLVAGDAKRRLGDESGAIASYRDALAIGVERRDAHAQVSALVALAEAGQRVATDAEVEALCASQDDRDRWTVARGRLALRTGTTDFSRGTRSDAGLSNASQPSGSHAGLSNASSPASSHAGSSSNASQPSGSHTGLSSASPSAGSHAGSSSNASPPTDSPGSPENGAAVPVRGSSSSSSSFSRMSRTSGALPALGAQAPTRDTGSPRARQSQPHTSLGTSSLSASQPALGTSSLSASQPALGTSSLSASQPALGASSPSTAGAASSNGFGASSLSAARTSAELGALARACSEVGTRATDGDRIERAFRAHAVASRLAARANEAAFARAEAERARAAHAAMLSAAAPAFRPAIEADPDLAELPAASAAVPTTARQRELPLRRLLTLSRRLNSEASVERILDEVIDTAIELTSAERGFLLLRQADGQLAPEVSRNFSHAELEVPGGEGRATPLLGISVSRSIAERAAQTGEPVMTVDAGVDERFGAAASVAALRLRSVLVVPLRQRGTITGCIYVDHRLRGGAFDDVAASVLGELADIAAIAIENARLTADLRRTSEKVDQLNARLSAELADKDAELARVKADLPDRDRLRHRYERIVGRSAATVRMLDIIDKATATSLPVVVVGESGTGKELVARALHDNGPRKDGPFVAINCSALPEPLLESELFGHVRGSFTGADRDRRGLFEVADGGTLFLDEIADTGAAMQAKLLRVLQDGVVRRVGDTKTRKVDVRVIAATQTPLADLVAQGRFREDLRFRVEVIAVPIPALRDRDGDIPLLVERLLQHLCPGKPPPRLTRAAMRALGAHRWPGNVRELENALARGVAMGGDVIDVGDLPEAVANAAGRPEPAKPVLGEDLRLKPALAATEQAYIAAAMSRAKGNQTVAARLLGLSRFGLQKKLRRLAGEDSDDDGDD